MKKLFAAAALLVSMLLCSCGGGAGSIGTGSAEPTTTAPETEPPKAGDFAGADAEYINKDTLNYYCVTNEAYIPEGKKVTGIVLEFPGLGGGSCLGGSMDNMIAYNTPFARECAAKGIVLAYTFPGPWSWMNTGRRPDDRPHGGCVHGQIRLAERG